MRNYAELLQARGAGVTRLRRVTRFLGLWSTGWHLGSALQLSPRCRHATSEGGLIHTQRRHEEHCWSFSDSVEMSTFDIFTISPSPFLDHFPNWVQICAKSRILDIEGKKIRGQNQMSLFRHSQLWETLWLSACFRCAILWPKWLNAKAKNRPEPLMFLGGWQRSEKDLVTQPNYKRDIYCSAGTARSKCNSIGSACPLSGQCPVALFPNHKGTQKIVKRGPNFWQKGDPFWRKRGPKIRIFHNCSQRANMLK